jgi:hypothetical protein
MYCPVRGALSAAADGAPEPTSILSDTEPSGVLVDPTIGPEERNKWVRTICRAPALFQIKKSNGPAAGGNDDLWHED